MHKLHFRESQTYFCYFITISMLILNIPFSQFPYILGVNTCRILFTGFISKRAFMVIVTFFESIFKNTIVAFNISCNNRCFVNMEFRKSVTIHRTVCFSTTIACFAGRWCWIVHSLTISFRITFSMLSIQIDLI